MKSVIFSAILLVFSAAYAQEEQTHELKMNTTCSACVEKVDKAVCQQFKSTLKECNPQVGSLTLKGKNIDMAAIKKAIAKTGYKIESTSTPAAAKDDHSDHSGH